MNILIDEDLSIEAVKKKFDKVHDPVKYKVFGK